MACADPSKDEQDFFDSDFEFEEDQTDLDGEFTDWDDCGMMPDGQCSKAGSEECDWDCPAKWKGK